MPDFTYFGESFAYADELPYFAEAEFMEMLERADVTPREATATALRLAKACVAPADLARFLAVSRKNNAKTDDWLNVYKGLVEGLAERPTGRPADSSAGRENTPQKSESTHTSAVSSHEETVRPIRPDVALALKRSA